MAATAVGGMMMKSTKGKISFLGKLSDPIQEEDFFAYDMERYAIFIGPFLLASGIINMIFMMADYFAIDNPNAYHLVLLIRIGLMMVSGSLCLMINKIKDYKDLTYIITAYEALSGVGFLTILWLYEALTLLSFISLIVMTLIIYIVPNRLIFAQVLSALLGLGYFIFFAKNIVGIQLTLLFEMITYYLIILIYCNLAAGLTNYYKRLQFLEGGELTRISITDPLTGIYNRLKFNEQLQQWIEYCNRYDSQICLVMFDLDDFKQVNDLYGHLMGDKVILDIVATIKKIIRKTDMFARWGGDEFMLLLPNTDILQARELVERLRAFTQVDKNNQAPQITCSFGLVQLKRSEKLDDLLVRVDNLLYIAKQNGKNTVRYEG